MMLINSKNTLAVSGDSEILLPGVLHLHYKRQDIQYTVLFGRDFYHNKMEKKKKCGDPDGWDISIGGIFSIDPCRYGKKRTVKNVKVCELQCAKCGHKKIVWEDDSGIQRTIVDESDGKKCCLPGGWNLQLGEREMDLCQYKVIDEYENATVNILQCKKCGNISVNWQMNPEENGLVDL